MCVRHVLLSVVVSALKQHEHRVLPCFKCETHILDFRTGRRPYGHVNVDMDIDMDVDTVSSMEYTSRRPP